MISSDKYGSNGLQLPFNSVTVLRRRYLQRDEKGKTKETPSELFRRVARAIAKAELRYSKKADVELIEKEFFKAMSNLEFLPNTPTLMNGGTKLGQLSACFVIPVEDSLKGIFDAAKWTAIIHQSGGGTGFSFSKLRPFGDYVKSTDGIASGPITFMTIFDQTTEVVKQGGKRRGANMGILNVDHPDIINFSSCKSKEGFLKNFNISVAVTSKFMKAVEKDVDFELINPRSQTLVGKIKATNPCGEQPLLPWESCNLGSINLSKVVNGGTIDWNKLKKLVQLGVRFLDNIIDINKYPNLEIQKITKANRKIGLGVMGFAEALIKLGVPYNSNDALQIGEKIMKFIEKEGHKTSQLLGKERGSFPNFKQSVWKQKKHYKYMRNATVTTIALTGTISIIAGCSSGIEPLFAISFVRNVMEGT